MGEPFLHSHIADFVRICREKAFIPILTTNGTLLGKPNAFSALDANPYKVQISLHSQEGNSGWRDTDYDTYLDNVMNFAAYGAQRGVIIVLRLWNQGGLEAANPYILSRLRTLLPDTWVETRNGYKLSENIFLEFDQVFEWPDTMCEKTYDKSIFCYALRNQIGVLVDGTVVPCCLDHDGDIPLGNLFDATLPEILATPRARSIYDGFTRHEAIESLCRKCGYAAIAKEYHTHK